MGKAIRKLNWKRSNFVISTKGEGGMNEQGLSGKHIAEGTKDCLECLQLDYVDLLIIIIRPKKFWIQAHRPDTETPMEETVRASNYVIERGWSGIQNKSQIDAYRIAEKLGLINCKSQHNTFHRENIKKEYLTLYAKYGFGIAVWSPLDSGILTGKYNNQIPADFCLSAKENTYPRALK
ncbi:hypothetical protein HK100_001316, partial [Physocladia obscura]